MIEQVFNVATEFKFDIGQALINTQALTSAVDDLSTAAQGGFRSLNFLAGGLVARLGLGGGGLLTVLSKAVSLAEDFDRVSLNFSGTIANNMSVLEGTIHTFNDRLATSQMILENISDIGIKFAIPTSQLAAMTNMLAPALARRGKLGRNFAGGIEMSKNLILGADALQLNPHTAGEALQRSISGDHMPLPMRLFQRLVSTDAFRQAGVGTQQKFMGLDAGKKIDLLDKALKAVAGDADMLTHRLGTLHGQMTILRNMVTDVGSILRPIGEALRKPLVIILQSITNYLKTSGKQLGVEFGKIITQFLSDPRAALINLLDIMRLGKDLKGASKGVEIYGTIRLLSFALGVLGQFFGGGLVKRFFIWLVSGIATLARMVPVMRILSGGFMLLKAAMIEILPVWAAMMFILRVISRAKSIAMINDKENLLKLAPRMAAVTSKFSQAISNIIYPITYLIDSLGQMIARFFETSFYIKLLLPVAEKFTTWLEKFGILMVKLTGLFVAAWRTLADIHPMMGGNPLLIKKAPELFEKHYSDFLMENQKRLGGDEMKATANYVTNIGTQNVRFDMREQLEPDRIAFAVTEHLKRLASNPTQGRGNSFRKVSSGGISVAGRQ